VHQEKEGVRRIIVVMDREARINKRTELAAKMLPGIMSAFMQLSPEPPAGFREMVSEMAVDMADRLITASEKKEARTDGRDN
jgi:hypothetical protein